MLNLASNKTPPFSSNIKITGSYPRKFIWRNRGKEQRRIESSSPIRVYPNKQGN
jgi:hypothetical protein